MKKIHVPIKGNEYDVLIKKGLISDVDKYLDPKNEFVIITDKNIPTHFIDTISTKINVLKTYTLEPGEALKCNEKAISIIEDMIQNKFTRSVHLIALGGGVIGDLTGFIASIYMRGVNFIQIPTSLLAQIDSSVGGKVGINSKTMKNSIGSFYQPQIVLIDPLTLDSLEEKHFNNGMAELIKHSLINGKRLFEDLLEKDINDNIEDFIYQSITIKKDIVIQDVQDKKIRQVLNYGHTIGHALEIESNYNLLHGEAISIGMAIMSQNTPYYNDLITLLEKFNLPTSYIYNQEKIYELIKTDKKITNNKLNLIIIPELGNALIKPIDVEKIKEYL